LGAFTAGEHGMTVNAVSRTSGSDTRHRAIMGLISPEGYTAITLFPHLLKIRRAQALRILKRLLDRLAGTSIRG
jgi:hypothetical protein